MKWLFGADGWLGGNCERVRRRHEPLVPFGSEPPIPCVPSTAIHCYPLISIANQCQPLLTYYRSPSRLFGCEVWPSYLPANWFATGGFCIKELIQFATCVLICQIQSIDEAVGVVALSCSMCRWIYRCCAPTVTYAIRRERQWLCFQRCLGGIGLQRISLLTPKFLLRLKVKEV